MPKKVKSPLTICYLAIASSIHTQRWVNYFAKKGHRVHLISFTPSEKKSIPHVSFHLLFNKIGIDIPALTFILNLAPNIFQIRKLLKEIAPDVLHAHEAVNYGRLGVCSGFHPLVITPWGTDIFIKSKKGVQKAVTRFTLKNADLITTDGENTKSAMVKMGIDSRQVAMIRFGVDTKKFRRTPSDETLKKTLGLEGQMVVISLRALARSHGVLTLIKAIPLVMRHFPNARFIIAGDPNYDKPYGERILQETRLLNIENAVRFIGYLSSDELPRYLNLADAYVSTGLSDSGLSSSTAEAMACELPVVATDVADNRLWIKDGEGGFIFPKHDHRALAKRIIEVLKKDKARDIFGSANRKMIVEHNDYETEMGKMEKCYQLLTKHHNHE